MLLCNRTSINQTIDWWFYHTYSFPLSSEAEPSAQLQTLVLYCISTRVSPHSGLHFSEAQVSANKKHFPHKPHLWHDLNSTHLRKNVQFDGRCCETVCAGLAPNWNMRPLPQSLEGHACPSLEWPPLPTVFSQYFVLKSTKFQFLGWWSIEPDYPGWQPYWKGKP